MNQATKNLEQKARCVMSFQYGDRLAIILCDSKISLVWSFALDNQPSLALCDGAAIP